MFYRSILSYFLLCILTPCCPYVPGDDGGSCIDGRLTSAWNWCSKLHKKPYYYVFMFTGFQGFDGDWKENCWKWRTRWRKMKARKRSNLQTIQLVIFFFCRMYPTLITLLAMFERFSMWYIYTVLENLYLFSCETGE